MSARSVLVRSSRIRGHGLTLAAGVAVVAIAALLMVPALDAPAAENDEGLTVAAPARLLHGELPQRDFYYPYSPGSVWVVAAADEVFGGTVGTERAVGMVYRLIIVAAAFALLMCWGLPEALLAAAIVAALLVGSVLAVASVGFWALALPGYALLARMALRPAAGRLWPLPVAGALLTASLLMRYDFLPAVVLGPLPAVLLLSRADRRRFFLGAAIGLVPLVVHLAVVGPSDMWRSVRIALQVHGHPARPPFASDLAELVTLYVVATVVVLAAGFLLERRAGRDPEARVLLGGCLFGIGMLPFAVTKPDEPHVVIAGLLALAMLPAAAVVLIRGNLLSRPTPPPARAFALCAVLLVMFLAGADAIRGPVYRQTQALVLGTRPVTYEVSNRGRSFPLADPQAARDVQVMVDAADRLARPGQSLFVGPQDLRTAGTADVFIYFLLDQLKPASYFIAVDPHTINRPRNGFVPELNRADFLILTTRETRFSAADAGPATPNQIVASRFCVRAESGTYRLYQRCR